VKNIVARKEGKRACTTIIYIKGGPINLIKLIRSFGSTKVFVIRGSELSARSYQYLLFRKGKNVCFHQKGILVGIIKGEHINDLERMLRSFYYNWDLG